MFDSQILCNKLNTYSIPLYIRLINCAQYFINYLVEFFTTCLLDVSDGLSSCTQALYHLKRHFNARAS